MGNYVCIRGHEVCNPRLVAPRHLRSLRTDLRRYNVANMANRRAAERKMRAPQRYPNITSAIPGKYPKNKDVFSRIPRMCNNHRDVANVAPDLYFFNLFCTVFKLIPKSFAARAWWFWVNARVS
jgi:hypothetical protein